MFFFMVLSQVGRKMAYTVEYSAGQGVKRHLRSINAVYGEKTASAVD
jgi:hypothetical protein